MGMKNSPFTRRRLTLGCLLVLSLSLSTVTVALAKSKPKPPTGNAAAIKFTDQVASTYKSVPGVTESQSGYMTYETGIELNGKPWASWSAGYGRVKKGYVKADESLTYGLSKGRIVWVEDVLTQACPANKLCFGESTLRLVADSHGTYQDFPGSSSRDYKCYTRETLTNTNTKSFWELGQPFITYDNSTLAPLTQNGDTTTVSDSWKPRDHGRDAGGSGKAVYTDVTAGSGVGASLTSFTESIKRGRLNRAYQQKDTVQNLTSAPKMPSLKDRCR